MFGNSSLKLGVGGGAVTHVFGKKKRMRTAHLGLSVTIKLQLGYVDKISDPEPCDDEIEKAYEGQGSLVMARMHIPLRTVNVQDIRHAIKNQTIILCWPEPVTMFRRWQGANNRPLFVRQSATYSLPSLQSRFESHRQQPERPFVNAI